MGWNRYGWKTGCDSDDLRDLLTELNISSVFEVNYNKVYKFYDKIW